MPDLTIDTASVNIVPKPDMTIDTASANIVPKPDLTIDTASVNIVPKPDLTIDTASVNIVPKPDLTFDTALVILYIIYGRYNGRISQQMCIYILNWLLAKKLESVFHRLQSNMSMW